MFPLCKRCADTCNRATCTHGDSERAIQGTWYSVELQTEEQKQRYVDDYLAVEEIQLDREKIEHNPGLRTLSKLMLNSFWGKYALNITFFL